MVETDVDNQIAHPELKIASTIPLDSIKKDEDLIRLDSSLIDITNNYMLDRKYAIGTSILYQKYIQKLVDDNNNLYLTRKLAKKILRKTNTYERAMVKLIINSYHNSDIPCPNFNFTQSIKTQRKLPDVYTIEEIKLMIESLPDYNSKLFFKLTFGIGSGLRISEVINMTWRDFNWVEWIQKGNATFKIKKTKRGKTYNVPVPNHLMQELLNKAKKEKIKFSSIVYDGLRTIHYPNENINVFKISFNNFNDSDYYKEFEKDKYKYLYTKKAYRWINYYWIEKHINKFLGRNFKMHSLRSSRATQLLKEGVDISIISDMLGHSDIKTTMIYTKIDTTIQSKAISHIPTI